MSLQSFSFPYNNLFGIGKLQIALCTGMAMIPERAIPGVSLTVMIDIENWRWRSGISSDTR